MISKKAHVVNISGGRTSGLLTHIMKERCDKAGESVEFLFCDTGAEHPKTYDFLRNIAKIFGIKITCLRPVFSNDSGVGVEPQVVSIDDVGYDLSIFKSMMEAYGAPFNPGGGFCTDRLKTTISDKYCDRKYGKGNYYKWIGYRIDEAKRAWGHKIYSKLVTYGFDSESSGELMIEAMNQENLDGFFENRLGISLDMFGDDKHEKLITQLNKKMEGVRKKGFRFMFEVSDEDKRGVKRWWQKQSFDLEIPEWLGNCMFCIKKGENRVALAAMDEPEKAEEWGALFYDASVRDMNRKHGNEVIYRHHQSIEMIRSKYAGENRENLIASLRLEPKGTADSCSDSCSPYSDQMDDLFDGVEDD